MLVGTQQVSNAVLVSTSYAPALLPHVCRFSSTRARIFPHFFVCQSTLQSNSSVKNKEQSQTVHPVNVPHIPDGCATTLFSSEINTVSNFLPSVHLVVQSRSSTLAAIFYVLFCQFVHFGNSTLSATFYFPFIQLKLLVS